MGSAKDTFQTTLENFKKRLTPKEQENFKFGTLEDVRKEIARIQNEQESLKAMMNMSRIQSFLEAMNEFSKVIEVFLNTSEFVAFVWGPMKFLLQVRLRPQLSEHQHFPKFGTFSLGLGQTVLDSPVLYGVPPVSKTLSLPNLFADSLNFLVITGFVTSVEVKSTLTRIDCLKSCLTKMS
jgi:hypothetical protein